MQLDTIHILIAFVFALVVHELGHLFAARACGVEVTQAGLGWGPKLYSVRAREVDYLLRLVPLGAYIRMDIGTLQKRPLSQQVFVLFAGIAVNLIIAVLAWGTLFGAFNLALAIGNLLPLYQQDGWKIGMVISRRVFGRPSPFVEWCFTISGVVLVVALVTRALLKF